MLLSPVITQDLTGWRVSVMRGERVESYVCETESAAKRFAQFLSAPPVEPPGRRAVQRTVGVDRKPSSPIVSLIRSLVR